MSHKHYKQMQSWEKQNLSDILGNKPTIKPIYTSTDEGWKITKYVFLVNIQYLADRLSRERKTIKNELIRGKYSTLSNDVSKEESTFSYSKDASDNYHKNMIKKKKFESTKISKFPKLREFIKSKLNKQSLKGIGGRTKLEFEKGNIEATITPKSLYNYVDNPNVDFINKSCLKANRKNKPHPNKTGKRINGKSIDERPDSISKRKEFGHWETDLIEGKKGTNVNLFTMSERKSKWGLAIKIYGKTMKTITKLIRKLQEQDVLQFGKNIFSITTDNGSEFWDWENFKKSIWNKKDDIEVYFCHPYRSSEKGGVENFNKQIRTKFPKGTDFTNISQKAISKHVNEINEVYRGTLGYKTANEVYNEFIQI